MVTYYLLTNKGGRDNNEDNVGMFQIGQEYCFALADGLGGHGKGELASKLAVDQAVAAFAQCKGASPDCIVKAFGNGQEEILKKQKEDRTAYDMKTTLVFLAIGQESVQWAHIGDSRLYHFEGGKLVGRTLDHSVPQMLVATGEIKEKQIRRHPDRNRLLRVMGIDWDGPRFQMGEAVERKAGQAFLLCSDGFWELIEEKKMIACLKRADTAKAWLEQMEAIVLKNGKGQDMDNYSAVGVWID